MRDGRVWGPVREVARAGIAWTGFGREERIVPARARQLCPDWDHHGLERESQVIDGRDVDPAKEVPESDCPVCVRAKVVRALG